MPRKDKKKFTSVAARIVEIRRDFRISQEEFGRRIGVRQSAVSKYEKSYPIPKVVRIAIAAVFGVNLSWIENGKSPKHVTSKEVTSHDLELLRFLKRQNTLYGLIRFHLNAVKRAARANNRPPLIHRANRSGSEIYEPA
jgi:transcriptional regulator with XRE-family HTH domain